MDPDQTRSEIARLSTAFELNTANLKGELRLLNAKLNRLFWLAVVLGALAAAKIISS